MTADVVFSRKISVDQNKGLHVCRCRVFTENIGEDQKKFSLFEMKSLIFSEALSFSLPSLLVNPALSIKSINQFSGLAYPYGVAGAAARVGASKHLDPLQQRIDALLGCQGETN